MAARRKLQFSLFTLFVAMTLCAVALLVWLSRPPAIRFLGENSFQLRDPQNPAAWTGFWVQQGVSASTPRASREFQIVLIVLAPPGTTGPAYTSAGMDTNHGVLSWGFRYDHPPRPGVLATPITSITYDARANTVAMDGNTLPCPPDSAILLKFDEMNQPHLSVDDGSFDSPELPAWLRDELRKRYQEMIDRQSKP